MYKRQLRQRPTYDEVIGYLENKQPKIKYPDRLATRILDTPQMGQFLGMGDMNMSLQQENILKEQLLLLELEKAGVSRREFKAQSSQTTGKEARAATSQTEYYNIDSDVEDIGETMKKEENKQQENREATASAAASHLFEETTPNDAAHNMAEKRAASQEARPGREKKTSKAGHEWHKPGRSRSPLRGDPEETRKVNQRLRGKSAPPPPAEAISPPAAPTYPSLNKESAREKVGTITRKEKSTPPPVPSSDDEEGLSSNVWGTSPSRIGIQELKNMFESAINKNKINKTDTQTYRTAYEQYLQAVKGKNEATKNSAMKEIRALYKRLFYKKQVF